MDTFMKIRITRYLLIKDRDRQHHQPSVNMYSTARSSAFARRSMMITAAHVCTRLVLLVAVCPSLGFKSGISPFRSRASEFPAPLSGRHEITALSMSTKADDTLRLQTRDELLELISETPRNSPTPKSTTADILSLVKELESMCPTQDTDVLPSLAGGWELLWTAQVR